MYYEPILISIEGNIGSGKSTLLRQLRERNPTWHFIDEPVDSWMGLKDAGGQSLLELFYSNTPRWAYTCQNTALLTRLLNTANAIEAWRSGGQPGHPIFITERCVNTDKNVFAKLLAEDGTMTSLEHTLYQKWFDAFALKTHQPAAYIHVDTPVTVCDERIHQRAREGEERIPVAYLDRLDSAHVQWLQDEALGKPMMRYDNVSAEPTTVESVEKFIQAQWLSGVD